MIIMNCINWFVNSASIDANYLICDPFTNYSDNDLFKLITIYNDVLEAVDQCIIDGDIDECDDEERISLVGMVFQDEIYYYKEENKI